ncbi:membrane protein [Cryobacterium sp. MLB-32]|nr:membrane protein [Cryobacterium sp. MLB-32]
MPLSEQEQRLLEEMERSLYHNDADFVASVGASRLRPNYRSIAIGVLLAVVGIVALIAGVALQMLWLGIVGFVVMFTGVLLALSPGKSMRGMPSAAAPGRRPAQGRADQGFMDRLNARWDRRQDGQ